MKISFLEVGPRKFFPFPRGFLFLFRTDSPPFLFPIVFRFPKNIFPFLFPVCSLTLHRHRFFPISFPLGQNYLYIAPIPEVSAPEAN